MREGRAVNRLDRGGLEAVRRDWLDRRVLGDHVATARRREHQLEGPHAVTGKADVDS